VTVAAFASAGSSNRISSARMGLQQKGRFAGGLSGIVS
jgi:hypothetical protein